MIQFSVVIPLYNKESSIIKTIDSVIAQTHKDFELIIVNDGSTDNSLAIIQNINDKRITIINTKNQGVSSARNTGVKNAKHPYITFLDADDYWHPNHLETMNNLISNYPESNWFATAYEIEHYKGLLVPIKTPLNKKGTEWSGIIDDYFANSMVDALAWTSAVCMKKDFFNTLGGFDEKLSNTEDTDLWIRATLQSALCFSNSITATYKINSGNHLSKKGIENETILDFDKYEKQHPENISLKQYLDYNRYSVALRYKRFGDKYLFNKYFKAISEQNLSHKQRTLLKMPNNLLSFCLLLKKTVEKMGFRLRSS